MTHKPLTARELEILPLVGRGWTYEEIAANLANLRSFKRTHITARTVRMHVGAIDQKLQERVKLQGKTPYRRVQRYAIDHAA
jgi:DNA-binding NarL/FixJ family response regulator